MPKTLVIDMEQHAQMRADELFETALKVVEGHGVCFLRFTRADGMVIIEPKYYQRINGAIADA